MFIHISNSWESFGGGGRVVGFFFLTFHIYGTVSQTTEEKIKAMSPPSATPKWKLPTHCCPHTPKGRLSSGERADFMGKS